MFPNDGDKNKEYNNGDYKKFHIDKYIVKSPIFQKISRKFQKTNTPFFKQGGSCYGKRDIYYHIIATPSEGT
jgi:hypothetical protein